MTVSWRRSAVSVDVEGAWVSDGVGLVVLRFAIALSSRFRGPMGTPSFSKSPSVKSGSTEPSISFFRKTSVARQSGWEGSDNQDGHFGGRGEEMIVAARR